MENLESRHRAIDRGNWVGIVTVAGFAEGVVAKAGAWRIELTKPGGCGEKVKDEEIGFGACGCRDVREFGGEGEG